MRVLIVHNRYRQPGGEDAVVQAETDLLRSKNVVVEHLSFSNEMPEKRQHLAQLTQLLHSSWSSYGYQRVQESCAQFKPHIMHVHNFWMQASPAVHAAATSMQVPTVQTLHNFRLLCANAQLLRKGQVCEDCVGKIPWRGVIHKCYRNSAVASAAASSMILTNAWRGTWGHQIDAFVALTAHAREKFVSGGIPPSRIFVKGNFVTFPVTTSEPPSKSQLCVYIGRLSEEKGLPILIRAWAAANLSEPAKLLIIGEGPQRRELEGLALSLRLCKGQVNFTGFLERSEIERYLSKSRFLVLPSIWYEGFPMVILEAAAAGRPAIVSRIGGLPELVHDNATGLLFQPGDYSALSHQLQSLMKDHGLVDRLGASAQQTISSTYLPTRNFETLMSVYRFAIQRRSLPVPQFLDSFPVATSAIRESPKAYEYTHANQIKSDRNCSLKFSSFPVMG